jgi:hypothetical protein
MNRSEYLLSSAITFKDAPLRQEIVPREFASISEAKDVMVGILLHEAREAFQSQINAPTHTLMVPRDEFQEYI